MKQVMAHHARSLQLGVIQGFHCGYEHSPLRIYCFFVLGQVVLILVESPFNTGYLLKGLILSYTMQYQSYFKTCMICKTVSQVSSKLISFA